MPEVAQGAEHGVRRGLAESAEAGVLDDVAEGFQAVEVVMRTVAVADSRRVRCSFARSRHGRGRIFRTIHRGKSP